MAATDYNVQKQHLCTSVSHRGAVLLSAPPGEATQSYVNVASWLSFTFEVQESDIYPLIHSNCITCLSHI